MNPINIQYVTDEKGNQIAVQIPIETWKEIRDHMPTFLEYMSLRSSLLAGFQEVKDIQAGKAKGKTIEEFLNELEE